MAKKRIDVDAIIPQVRLQEQAGDPAVPTAGYTWLYTKALGLYLEQDDGTVLGPFGAGGGGGGMQELIFLPKSNEPPATNYATLDTRNIHPILDFDKDTDESAVFSCILPSTYAGGGLTAYIHWSADGVTVNDVVWDVSFERIGTAQDVDVDSFAAVQSVTDTAPGTDGFVAIASIGFTNGAQMDSIAAGELFRVKITRDADSGNDDLDADAELHALHIVET
ncbi:unnamed protein product [marine sediment metagenome]|uniref:Uncharacterized protein n=1 Tax=marine sediment metagenome TaxID=412755 RepID=X1A9R7_9ZZZZ